MANIDRAHEFPDGIQIGEIGIFSGDYDPSIIGAAAPSGSLFIQYAGLVYKKNGPLNTDWTSFVEAESNIALSYAMIINDEHKKTTYTKVARFYFRGTNEVGNITDIDGILYKQLGSGNYSARVYDVDNGLVIAEAIGLTNTNPQQISFGTISNLPSSGAVLEVQTVTSDSNRYVYCDSMTVTYGV
jgi:hypothetical protein